MPDIARKSRLGRGISSLIRVDLPEPPAPQPPVEPAASVPTIANSAPVTASDASGTPLDLPVDQVVPNPHQPRRDFDRAQLDELASSIRASGVIQPIIVRKTGDARYELIAGERRLRAARLAGLEVIPAIVREVDALTQAQMALIENIQRADLNPIERAVGYRSLLQQLSMTQEQLATRLGEDRSSIANHLRLLDLPNPVQKLLSQGKLSLGHAKILAGIPDAGQQEQLAAHVVEQGLSVRALERLLTEPPVEAPAPPPTSAPAGEPTPPPRDELVRQAHLRDLEQRFSAQTGVRISIRPAKGKPQRGRIIFHYANLDQFDELVDRLGLKLE